MFNGVMGRLSLDRGVYGKCEIVMICWEIYEGFV